MWHKHKHNGMKQCEIFGVLLQWGNSKSVVAIPLGSNVLLSAMAIKTQPNSTSEHPQSPHALSPLPLSAGRLIHLTMVQKSG